LVSQFYKGLNHYF